MVRNRIKVLLAEAEITATTLVEKMPAGVDKVAMSYITNGRVLPTRESLETMCDVFSCTPADIYEPREIDLLSVRRQAAQAVQSDGCPKTAETGEKQDDGMADVVMQPSPRKDSNTKNEGMEQFRVWLPAEEKAALFKAIAGLGYHSAAEWLREKYRATLREYIALQLNNKTLHEAIPPHRKESNDQKLLAK